MSVYSDADSTELDGFCDLRSTPRVAVNYAA